MPDCSVNEYAYRAIGRVAPDMIFSNPAGAGFGIANPAEAAGRMFFELWAYVT